MLASSVSKKPYAAMLSLDFSIRSTGLAVSGAQWSRRSKVAWLRSRNSLSRKFSSTMKTSQMRSACLTTLQVGACCSRRLIQIPMAVSTVHQHHRSLIPTLQAQGPERTRYSKHPQDHRHAHHPDQVLSRHRQMATGNSQARSVGRRVLSKNSIPTLQAVEAEPTARSVRPMFWKSSTILHGARVYVEVLQREDAAKLSDAYVTIDCIQHACARIAWNARLKMVMKDRQCARLEWASE